MLYGELALWQPVWIIIYSLAVIMVVPYLSVGQYSRKENDVGWIEPVGGRFQIYATRVVFIAETMVKPPHSAYLII